MNKTNPIEIIEESLPDNYNVSISNKLISGEHIQNVVNRLAREGFQVEVIFRGKKFEYRPNANDIPASRDEVAKPSDAQKRVPPGG